MFQDRKNHAPLMPDRTALPTSARRALRVVLAFNPASGRFRPRALARLREAMEAAGHRVRCESSRDFRFDGPGDPVDVVCAFGGDGTARTVISENSANADRATYCVYPAGTINLIAREARYPDEPTRFTRLLHERSAAMPHYYGTIGDDAFLCCASVGPDAEVVARVSTRLKRHIGQLAYGVALLGLLWKWPRRPFEAEIDGVRHTGEALFVCNGRYYAGPWVIDPAARLVDDHFRILLMPRARRRDMLRLAISAVISPALGDNRWVRVSGRLITVSGAADMPIQADGDVVAATPATISIAPAPLHFL